MWYALCNNNFPLLWHLLLNLVNLPYSYLTDEFHFSASREPRDLNLGKSPREWEGIKAREGWSGKWPFCNLRKMSPKMQSASPIQTGFFLSQKVKLKVRTPFDCGYRFHVSRLSLPLRSRVVFDWRIAALRLTWNNSHICIRKHRTDAENNGKGKLKWEKFW